MGGGRKGGREGWTPSLSRREGGREAGSAGGREGGRQAGFWGWMGIPSGGEGGGRAAAAVGEGGAWLRWLEYTRVRARAWLAGGPSGRERACARALACGWLAGGARRRERVRVRGRARRGVPRCECGAGLAGGSERVCGGGWRRAGRGGPRRRGRGGRRRCRPPWRQRAAPRSGPIRSRALPPPREPRPHADPSVPPQLARRLGFRGVSTRRAASSLGSGPEGRTTPSPHVTSARERRPRGGRARGRGGAGKGVGS